MLAAWLAQVDLPSLDSSSPEGLRSLLGVSFLLMPIGMLVAIVGHVTKLSALVATGILLVMAGSVFFVIAIAGYG